MPTPVLNISLIAAADLSSSQWYAVKIDTSGLATLCGAGEDAIGILQNIPESGQVASVMVDGETLVALGGSVTAGDALTADSAGKIVAGSTITANFATAMESGNSGEVVRAVMKNSFNVPKGALAISIPIPAMSGVANGDLVTEILPGFAGRIFAMEFVCTTAVSTAAKTFTVNAEIGTTNCTGSLVVAGTYALGATERVAVTALNTFDEHDKISIEIASTTTFSEGAGVLILWIDRTPDVANSGFDVISVPITMATIANGDIITQIVPGYAGRIYGIEYVCTTAVTTGAKTTTLNVEINAVNTAGTVVVAGAYAVGAVQRADLSAPNEFSATDTLSLEAATTTTFIEGAGVILLYIDKIPYSTSRDSATIAIPIAAMSGVSDADLITTITPGFAGRIIGLEFVCTTAITTGAKATTLNAEIGTTDCTGSLVVSGTYALGATEIQAVTASNTFTATDTLSIEATSTTTFSEGAGVLLIHCDRVLSA